MCGLLSISSILTYTTDLEELYVDVGGYDITLWQELLHRASYMGQSFAWTRLRKFFLIDYNATQELLIQMLEPHKENLQELSLHHICLQDADSSNQPAAGTKNISLSTQIVHHRASNCGRAD